ncbi:MAG TPA: protein kinase [Pyrinomonadaceae bacterium]|nr:protein kinase [Pyrinomonadaceae bacterium]
MKLAHLVGEVLDEKYRIEKLLGQGGMGAVFLAIHLGTERPVALKVITPEFMKHGEFVERFRREARAAGRLRHPNVVDVTDFGFARVGAEDERVAYLVMEYLDGCTLAEVLMEESSLPLSWVVDILEQTCSAVDEAHKQGIVHRDLKPDNIWLEPNRRGGYTVKVLDFGIARLGDSAEPGKATGPEAPDVSAPNPTPYAAFSLESPTLVPPPPAEVTESPTMIRPPASVTEDDDEESSTMMLPAQRTPLAEEGTRILDRHTTGKQLGGTTAVDERLTRIGSILGTPLYMSPEQCRGETSDARSDIYSLGVIGYQMLAGQTPFNGQMDTVIRQHLTAPPPPLDIKKIPWKVAGVIMSALAKDPAWRPPTAAAFASALRAHSSGTGELLRRALTLFGEHLPVFLRLALIVYAPMILLTIVSLVLAHLYGRGVVSPTVYNIANPILDLVKMLVAFFVAGCVLGLTVRVVTQLLVAPLRPLKLKTAFQALRQRLKTLTLTSMFLSFLTMIGVTFCLIPGFLVLINFFLVTPVVMMEEKRGRAAFKRARELASRSWRTVTAVVLLQMLVPFLVAVVVAFLAVVIVKAFNPTALKIKTFVPFFNTIFQLAQLPLIFLIGSYSAVVTSLLYWKTRLAGGETLKEVFQEFEEEELPDRNWQKRMRERLHLTTRTNRSDPGRSRLDR